MRVYRISWLPIVSFLLGGSVFMIIPLMDLNSFLSSGIYVFVGLLVFSFIFLWSGFYLLFKRRQGSGYYWDEEGIVIDLRGNKVYWDEIEDIAYFKTRGMKSTVIYPHYWFHETIRARRNKILPTPAHSIDWYLIERPREFHTNLIEAWKDKSKGTAT